jgi:hypothetical protein
MDLSVELNKLKQVKIDLKNAINNKVGGITDQSITEYAKIIEQINPENLENRVRFLDYDGTILKTVYVSNGGTATPPEEMPEHPNLVFQGWNNPLDNVQGSLDIGAIYTTASGFTELDVRMEAPTGTTVSISPYLESGTLTIDWGDGSETELTGTGKKTTNYTYATYGNYTITLKISQGGSWYIPDGFVQGTSDSYYLLAARITGISKLNQNAFYGKRSLHTVTLSNDIKTFGDYCFYRCMALKAINIPENLTTLGRYTFQECYAISRVSIGKGITSIPYYGFYSCYSLDTLIIPHGVTTIDSYAFAYCRSLKIVTFPPTLTTINGNAFYECYSLLYADLPDSITTLGSYTFYYCYSLRRVHVPIKITNIPSYFCYYCYSLQEVNIPDGVTNINERAFEYCYNLMDIKIPENVSNISNGAFRYCYGLRNVYIYRPSPASISSNTFESIPQSASIFVPSSQNRLILTMYKTASYWSSYANWMKEIPEEEVEEEKEE